MSVSSGGFKPSELVVFASIDGYKKKDAGYICNVIDRTVKQFPMLTSDDVVAVIRSYFNRVVLQLPVMSREDVMDEVKSYLQSQAFLDAIQVAVNEKTNTGTL
jgi:hypothetical protein